MSRTRFELTFEGAACQDGEAFPRFRRYHQTIEQAEEEARRVRAILERRHNAAGGGTTIGSHAPQIYGPHGVSTIPW